MEIRGFGRSKYVWVVGKNNRIRMIVYKAAEYS